MITRYTNGRLILDGRICTEYDLLADQKYITGIVPRSMGTADIAINLDGKYLSAGWIDIHCHGGDNAEFISGNPDDFERICAVHAEHGTGVLYPTLSACDFATIKTALSAFEKVKSKCALHLPGIHLEGPYLSRKMSGAQVGKWLRSPDIKEVTKLLDEHGRSIARWTYAPELDADNQFLNIITEHGIIASTGHSAAEYSDIRRALTGGNRLITHLYSCTSSVTRHNGFRRLGVIESAFLEDNIFVEAIADGRHLPPELLKMIVKLKGKNRTVLVTDAIAPAGAVQALPNKQFVVEDGVAKLPDRTVFAGSIATMDTLVKTALSAGIDLPDVIAMITETPAKVMGLSEFGLLAPGKRAIFTIFDENIQTY